MSGTEKEKRIAGAKEEERRGVVNITSEKEKRRRKKEERRGEEEEGAQKSEGAEVDIFSKALQGTMKAREGIR